VNISRMRPPQYLKPKCGTFAPYAACRHGMQH
jgi:hypothetical protein